MKLTLSMTLCLMILSRGGKHGYAIMTEIAKFTDYEVSAGTLYRSLDQMVLAGLIKETATEKPEDDMRRKYYCITEEGRQAVSLEFDRLERLVYTARSMGIVMR